MDHGCLLVHPALKGKGRKEGNEGKKERGEGRRGRQTRPRPRSGLLFTFEYSTYVVSTHKGRERLMSFFVPLHFIFPRQTLKRVIIYKEGRKMLRPTAKQGQRVEEETAPLFALKKEKKKKKKKRDVVVFFFFFFWGQKLASFTNGL